MKVKAADKKVATEKKAEVKLEAAKPVVSETKVEAVAKKAKEEK